MALSTGEATAGSNFADAMKTFYLPALNDQVNRATVMLDRLKKSSKEVSGNFAYLALIATRNPAVGSRADSVGAGPLLPAIGTQTYKSATFLMAHHYGRGAVTGPVMRASKSDAGAFARALNTEMEGLSLSLPEELNRQLWSYGHGRAATLDVDQATSTLLTISNRAIFSARIGARVHAADIAAGTGIVPAAGTTVVAITRDNTVTTHQLELAAAAGTSLTAADDAIYFGAQSSLTAEGSSRAQDMFGIPAAIDDGAIGADEGLGGVAVAAEADEILGGSLAYGGIDRTASAGTFYRSTVMQNPDSAGLLRPITVPLFEQAFLNATVVGGAKAGDLELFSDAGSWATFGLLHIGDRIFNDFKETLEGGWIALKFNDRPYFFDRDAPRHAVWFLDMATLLLMEQGGFEFMDKDGGVLERVANRDAYEFTLYSDKQLGCKKPNSSVKLMDLSPSFYVEADV